MLLSITAYINNCYCYSVIISLPGLVQGSGSLLDVLNGTALHEMAHVLSKLKVTFVFSKCFHSYSTFKHSLICVWCVHLFWVFSTIFPLPRCIPCCSEWYCLSTQRDVVFLENHNVCRYSTISKKQSSYQDFWNLKVNSAMSVLFMAWPDTYT